MNEVKISKFMSLVLRHKPEEIGVVLNESGWVKINDLIDGMNKRGMAVERLLLQKIVDGNDKKRFAISDDGEMIRANQGHSLVVDLNLVIQVPPKILYHGTATRNMNRINESGLLKMNRHHVHLSTDVETAKRVGSRHGRVVVFVIDCKAMTESGYAFYRSENNVWLVDSVPVKFLSMLEEG
ncbi:MAG: putative 2-phosphotransferase [Patescibacteria group bacterium]|nr:putative 2-phosphotransferase [Patescibacteria group bacterium]